LSYDKNNNEDVSGQHIKLLLDLQSENQKDVYDYYDDYRGKNIEVLIDDCKLNNEMENNSKPVTKTLSESQKRKRCTTIMAQTLDAKKRQKSQELPAENVENENKSALRCKDCKFSKSNDNSSEPIKNFNSQINEMDDDYLIIILKQLIDKLNKTDKLKSIFYEDIPVQRSSGRAASLEDQTVGTKNANSSSEEEWILKLKKTKRNQILDKLNSSLENTLMNGKWIKSKITKNKSNDCSKPTVINDLRSDLNDKKEPVSNSDVKPLDLKSPENHVIDIDGNISKNSNCLQTMVNTQENKEFTTAQLLEESDRLSESRETVSPSYLLSTPVKDVYDFNTVDGNNKDRDINKDNFEPTAVNNYQPTSILESNEESTSDLNCTIRIKDTDEISESNVDINDNSPKINSSEGAYSNSVEKEHGSLENNANNCDCNKKVIKNILSSKLIKNPTKINTDTYALPNSRMKGHRRLDRSQKKNDENDNSKNASGETIALKNDNNLKSNLLKTRLRTTKISHKNNIDELKTHNKSQKFILINNDDDQSQNSDYDNRRNIMNAKATIPYWERFILAIRRKNNYDENNINSKVDEKKSFSIPKISTTQKNLRRFVEKLKQPQRTDTYEGNNIGKYNNVDRMAINKRISFIQKSSAQISNRIIDRNPPRNIPEKSRERTVVHYDDNSSKNNRRIIDTKLKQDVPTNRNTQRASRYGKYDNNNADDVTKKVSSKSKSLSRVTTKSTVDKSLPKIMSRRQEKNRDGNETINRKGLGKLTKEPHTYGSFNSSTRIDRSHEGNFDSENGHYSRENDEGNNDLDAAVKLRNPSNSSRSSSTNGDEIQTIPENTYEHIRDIVYPIDGKNDGKPFVRNVSMLKRPKPTESVKTPKSKTPTDTIASPTANDEIISTLKLKKSPDGGKRVGSRPLNERYTSTTEHYHDDLLEKPDWSSKDKNTSDDDRSASTGAGFVVESGRKWDFQPKRAVPSKSERPKPCETENADYAPYTAEDLRPIVFDESARRPVVGPGSKHAIRAERDERPNDDEDRRKYPHGSNEDYGKPGGRGTFQVLHGAKVMVDGVFNVPSVGRVDRDGSVSVLDVLIPIEDGRRHHSAASLAELLTGDFRLYGGGDVAASEPATRSSKDRAAPVHVIRIINNNGACSPNCRTGAKSRDDRVDPRRGGAKSAAGSRNTPGRGQISPPGLRNAYSRFNPEIVDGFLRVYAPPYTG